MKKDEIVVPVNYFINELGAQDFFTYRERFSKLQFRRDLLAVAFVGITAYLVLSKVQDIMKDRWASQKIQGI